MYVLVYEINIRVYTELHNVNQYNKNNNVRFYNIRIL